MVGPWHRSRHTFETDKSRVDFGDFGMRQLVDELSLILELGTNPSEPVRYSCWERSGQAERLISGDMVTRQGPF
jgi:hypothetical protein